MFNAPKYICFKGWWREVNNDPSKSNLIFSVTMFANRGFAQRSTITLPNPHVGRGVVVYDG
jgi:hypothetical protein